MASKKPELNNVKNRFLPIPQSALKCLEPEPKIKDFEILKELGCGSFGRVFLARHIKTKVLYAIKAIDKQNKTNIDEKPYYQPTWVFAIMLIYRYIDTVCAPKNPYFGLYGSET